jgi:GT2 family glycosyltransferase
MSVPARRDPDITLVIPTLGRALLRRTLESVLAGTVWPGRIVVVDQGRRPEIQALAVQVTERGLPVDYVPSDRRGRSAGLNTGIARVETRFLAITDDDCPVAPDWIARMGDRLRAHPDAIVTGRAVAGEGEVQLAVVTEELESVQRRPSLKFDRMTGANVGMALEVFRATGPFAEDPSMQTAEDVEFAYRALRRGIPIVYAPELVVEHLGWRGEDERNDQYRGYARSHGGVYGWYLRKGDLFLAARMMVHLGRASRRWVRATMLGDREGARNGKAYVLGLWTGVLAGWTAAGRSP